MEKTYKEKANLIKHSKLDFDPPPLREVCPLSYKTFAIIIFLTIAGVVFTVTGLTEWKYKGLSESWPFLLLGFLVFTPGIYHLTILLQILRKVPGYNWDMIPNLD